MVHHLGFTRKDVMEMPTRERRGHIFRLKNEVEKQKEMMEDAKATSQSGKGKNTKTVSGEALKTKMRNGEIN
jgi:hypothetical protein